MRDFAGIGEKLKRAKENIGNLDLEIATFFQECDYPVIPENDLKLLLQAIEYHKNLPIPLRFSVLSGEIVHHLRSCLDHVVWHFTVLPVKNVRKIEFPVFDERPINHDSRRLFKGKIEGVANTNVRSLIERLQPYNSAQPFDDPLWIIHDFDITDKHRELVLSIPTGARNFPIEMQPVIEAYQRAHPDLDATEVAHHFKEHGPMTPCISFRDMGGRKIQPVVPGLTNLFNYTVEVVKKFQVL